MTVLGPGGMTWLVAGVLAITLALGPINATAGLLAGMGWQPVYMPAAAATPLEAQIMGDRPVPSSPHTPQSLLQELNPGLELDRQGSSLRLPHNFRISFRYNSDNPSNAGDRLVQPPLLFRYSMDYCLLPNLQVGMSGFLYQPPGDHLSFLSRGRDPFLMGWGPSLKYDLGRWSFTFRSQVEKGRPEGGKDLQNWFRVWYAF